MCMCLRRGRQHLRPTNFVSIFVVPIFVSIFVEQSMNKGADDEDRDEDPLDKNRDKDRDGDWACTACRLRAPRAV
jgi:hypothetical protein